MKNRPRKYWAIGSTLLFHTILVWVLFFMENNRFERKKIYELELETRLSEEKILEKQKELEELAKKQVQELLSNKGAKRFVAGEKLQESTVKDLKEAYNERERKTEEILKKREQKTEQTESKEITLKEETEAEPEERQTVFFVGNSRVEYFLAERYRVKLPIPVYQCEGGGVVEISIQVNKEGMVVSAEVVKQRSRSASDCMQEAALASALNSQFSKRPEYAGLQKGRIVYQFVPQ